MLLLDEQVLVISTFELNKVASLTYNEIVCDDLFEVMEVILAHPLRQTPLALTKTLVVMQHCLVYGSEKCVNSGYGIAKFVEALTNYNTVLINQQRQGPGGLISRIKGGGVDKGEPVRDAAKKIAILLANIKDLQRIRNENANKDSLVPVGSNKVGFITDEVRLLILQKRIEKQNQINLKSNLAKAEGGFGGGYNAADGKSVVGAAHGIEEMMKMAKKTKKKFSDEGTVEVEEPEDERILRELMEEANAAKKERDLALQQAEKEQLAAAAANAREVDLLDFSGGGVTTTTTTTTTSQPMAGGTADLLGGGDADLLGGMAPPMAAPVSATMDPFAPVGTQAPTPALAGNPLNDLLAMATGQSSSPAPASNDPFGNTLLAPAPVTQSAGPVQNPMPPLGSASDFSTLPSITSFGQDATDSLGATMQSMSLQHQQEERNQSQTESGMAPSEDRFAALDALAENSSTSAPISPHDAQNAEHRILGFAMPPSSSNEIPPAVQSVAPSAQYSAEPPAQSAGAGQIATKYGDVQHNEEADADADNPWVMGGAAGTGLGDPLAPAPGAPPPPPPSA